MRIHLNRYTKIEYAEISKINISQLVTINVSKCLNGEKRYRDSDGSMWIEMDCILKVSKPFYLFFPYLI